MPNEKQSIYVKIVEAKKSVIGQEPQNVELANSSSVIETIEVDTDTDKDNIGDIIDADDDNDGIDDEKEIRLGTDPQKPQAPEKATIEENELTTNTSEDTGTTLSSVAIKIVKLINPEVQTSTIETASKTAMGIQKISTTLASASVNVSKKISEYLKEKITNNQIETKIQANSEQNSPKIADKTETEKKSSLINIFSDMTKTQYALLSSTLILLWLAWKIFKNIVL